MKIAFCGFGVAGAWVLCYLVGRFGSENIIVFTHQDTVTGKGLGQLATELDCCWTTESINTARFEAEIIASVYYRTIIKQHVIERVEGRIFNAHTSLLPRHRGRSPLSWAIIEGDQYTGVTFHYIDAGIDTGPVLMQKAVLIEKDETLLSLFGKVNLAVFEFFPMALELVLARIPGIKQSGVSNHNPTGVPFNGEIDPSWSFDKVERFIRAMTYPPLPYATYNSREVKTMLEYIKARNEKDTQYYHYFSFPR